ncbi:hypothetical protein V6N13_034852 [Hibiscus sabdariffa]
MVDERRKSPFYVISKAPQLLFLPLYWTSGTLRQSTRKDVEKGVWEKTARVQTADYSRLDDLLYKDGRLCRAKKGVSRSFMTPELDYTLELIKLWLT